MQAVVIKLYNDKKTENACTVENTFKNYFICLIKGIV